MRQDGKGSSEQKSRVVHNVHILDASGSMAGGKYNNALAGIQKEIEELKEGSDGNTITNTVIEFSSSSWRNGGEDLKLTEHCFMVPAANCPKIRGRGANGGTPLYQTVGETIERLVARINPGEKVIMTIFTDGAENESRGIYRDPETLKKLIKQVEDHHNFTVTYSGTENDIYTVVQNLGVNLSNTMAHFNTAASVGQTYSARTAALKSYSKAVARGASTEELKQNFFKGVADESKEEEKTK